MQPGGGSVLVLGDAIENLYAVTFSPANFAITPGAIDTEYVRGVVMSVPFRLPFGLMVTALPV
jgi:hypothetical protein